MKRGFLISGCQTFDWRQKSERQPIISMLGLSVKLPLAEDMMDSVEGRLALGTRFEWQV